MKKTPTRLFAFTLACSMMLSLTPVQNTQAKVKKAVEKTELSSKKVTLTEGKSKTIRLNHYKKLDKKQIKKVKWTTSKKSVATIKPSGKYKQICKITAKKEGTATVKLKYDGKTYKCTVKVDKKTPSTQEATTEDITIHTHKYGEWVTTKNATCEEAGEEARQCATCSNIEKRQTPAKGHNWSGWMTLSDASCGVTGLKTRLCLICAKQKQETIPAKEHAWSDLLVLKEPTCGEDGLKSEICDNCGKMRTQPIPSETKEHDWGEFEATLEATCNREGIQTRKCKNCEQTETQKIPTKEHTWGDWTIIKEPTYNETGSQIRTCEKCNKTETQELEKTEHDYDTYTITKEPTCTEEGEKTYTCKICNENITETIPALGHKGEWNIETEVTCTEKGKVVCKCKRCNTVMEEQEVPAAGHTEVSVGEKDVHSKCSVCNEVIKDGTGHVYKEEIMKEATCKEEGQAKYTCECGYSETKVLNKRSHTYNSEHQCIYCGQFDTESVVCEKNVTEYDQKEGVVCYTYKSSDYTDENPKYDLYIVTKEEGKRFGRYRLTDEANIPYVKSIKIANPTVLSKNAYTAFSNYDNLSTIDLSLLDTSITTNMSYLFANCKSLQAVDISGMDTKNVTNFAYMFSNCVVLRNITGLNKIDTSKAEYMDGMFSTCKSIEKLDLSNFNTSSATNMGNMFLSCYKLQDLNISSFNTLNVTNMSGLFNGCYMLSDIDLSKFDTSNVTDMSYMFFYCKSLNTLDISNFDTTNVTNMHSMFYECVNIKNIILGDYFVTDNTTDMVGMFNDCENLEYIKRSDNADIVCLSIQQAIKNNPDLVQDMFIDCNSLQQNIISNSDFLYLKNK